MAIDTLVGVRRTQQIDAVGAIIAPGTEVTQAAILAALGGNLKVVGNVAHDAVDSGAPVKIGGVANSTFTAVASGDRIDAQFTTYGSLKVNLFDGAGNSPTLLASLVTGGKSASSVGLTTVAAQFQSNGSSIDPATKPASDFYLASCAANNNAQVIRSGKTDLHYLIAENTTGATIYAKLYNQTGTPAPATDAEAVVIPLRAGFTFIPFARPRYFSTGLGLALVTGAAVDDNTAPTAGAVIALSLGYCSIT